MKSNYLYNNEGLATLAIGQFIKVHETIEISKVVFILPFVFHDLTVKRLRSKSYNRSLEEFIIKNIDCVINFNERFYNFLPITLNAITILYEAKIIFIKHEMILFNSASNFSIENNITIGKRAENMLKAIEELNTLMKSESVNSFYLKLKIKL